MNTSKPVSLAELRRDFPVTDHAVYMDHAAVGPIPLSVTAAIERQMRIQAHDIHRASQQFQSCYSRTREAAARLVGARPERIAFVHNTSHGISLLANGQDWRAGDNVIVPALEFPSNYLPWLRLENQGVQFRRLEATDGRITVDTLSNVIDRKTRIVTLSAVQYWNGYRPDLAAIAQVARAQDACLVVDGTQSVGALEIDVAASGIDALVVSAHKWMLGPLGIGFMALSDRLFERTAVTEIGWLTVKDPFAFRREIDPVDDATRFEPGTENSAGIFGFGQRLDDIERYGAANVEHRVLGLTFRLADGLLAKGFVIDSPMEDGVRSGILTFRHDRLPGQETVEVLKRNGFYLSFRHGAIRASPHYYNSEAEIDALVERLCQDL